MHIQTQLSGQDWDLIMTIHLGKVSTYPRLYFTFGWLGSRVVSVLDSGAEGPGFKIVVTTLSGNSLRQTVNTAGFMTHVTCRLTAKNRDQLRNPTISSRVWATFTFYFTL